MNYKTIESVITFLRMDNPPVKREDSQEHIIIKEFAKPIDIAEYLRMYRDVGAKLNWLDRVSMDTSELNSKINHPNTHIHTFSINKKFAGYCELIKESQYVEILYFGLTEPFIGKGFGKYLLNKTIELAWNLNPEWIQLNTCDLDHPNALSTYKKAGFKAYKTKIEEKRIK